MEKKCNNCQLHDAKEMAQIPYIEHELRMYKAYRREYTLKIALACSNCAWFIGLLILLFAR